MTTNPKDKRREYNHTGHTASTYAKWLSVKSGKAKVRKCLRCQKGFDSYGPQNRLCGECHQWADENTPLVETWSAGKKFKTGVSTIVDDFSSPTSD